MPPKMDLSHHADIVDRYLSGESAHHIAKSIGCSTPTVFKHLTEKGIQTRGKDAANKLIGVRNEGVLDGCQETVFRLYNEGISIAEIARRLNSSLATVQRLLRRSGAKIRSKRDAIKLWVSQLSDEERRRMTEIPRAVVTGNDELKDKIAKAREDRSRWQRVGEGEDQLMDWLTERGFSPIRQKAVGPYNLDFAVNHNAIELFAEGAHPLRKDIRKKRFEYLVTTGWNVIIVWSGRRKTLHESVVDVLDQLMQENTQPCITIIRGDGQLVHE